MRVLVVPDNIFQCGNSLGNFTAGQSKGHGYYLIAFLVWGLVEVLLCPGIPEGFTDSRKDVTVDREVISGF